MDEKIKDLNLLLLYLYGWQEDSVRIRAKNLPGLERLLFEVLNRLADDKLIIQFANTKSVTLTEAGSKARQLKEQFFSEKGGTSGKW